MNLRQLVELTYFFQQFGDKGFFLSDNEIQTVALRVEVGHQLVQKSSCLLMVLVLLASNVKGAHLLFFFEFALNFLQDFIVYEINIEFVEEEGLQLFQFAPQLLLLLLFLPIQVLLLHIV